VWPGVAVRAPSLPLVVRGRPGEGVALSVLDRGRFPRTGHRDGRGIAFCAVELYTMPVAYPCAHHTSSLCSAIVLRRRSSASHNVTRPSTLVEPGEVWFYGCTIAVSVSVLCRGITAITYL
jgi:hypothetical protein